MGKKNEGLFGRLFGSKPQEVPAPPPVRVPRPAPPAAAWPKTASIFSLGIPSAMEEYKAKYTYEDLAASFDSNSYSPGLALNLRATGEIYADGKKIGEFSSERIQKMLHDFYDRGDPVAAKLRRMNEDGTGLIYAVFYKIPQYSSERICKVSGTGSESKQEELMLLSPGDELYLEEDLDHEGRVNVSDVGYLGAKDAEWALDELNFDFCEVSVDTVELNDSGKYVLTVRIRY